MKTRDNLRQPINDQQQIQLDQPVELVACRQLWRGNWDKNAIGFIGLSSGVHWAILSSLGHFGFIGPFTSCN